MINLLIILVVIGVALYLLETYVPMAEPIRIVIRVVVVLFLLIYILRLFGVVDIPMSVR